MKIVKDQYGNYAIRKWVFAWWYKDLFNNFWWNKGDKYFGDCMTTDKTVVEDKLKQLLGVEELKDLKRKWRNQ